MVLPSGTRYWTVLDDDLGVVPVRFADSWGRYQRFGRSRAELTTRTNAGGAALYLRWCDATGQNWRKAPRDLGLFIVWLKHTPSRADDDGPVVVRSGPGGKPVRRERRINVVLSATRGFLSYAVSIAEARGPCSGSSTNWATAGTCPRRLRGRTPGCHRLRARHRLQGPTAELESAERDPASGASAVSRASLQADLANAQARTVRLSARIRQLERRLSQELGEQAWRESGLGAPSDIEKLQRTITRLEQRDVELTEALDESQADLAAAREANRELTRTLNQLREQPDPGRARPQ